MSDAWLVALGGLIVGVVGAVAAAFKMLFESRHAALSRQERTALKQWIKIADDRDVQIQRQATHIEELQEAVRELTVIAERQYGMIERDHDWMGLAWQALKDCGKEIPPPPKLPPRPERVEEKERAQFLARTTEENTGLLAKTTPPPSPPQKDV